MYKLPAQSFERVMHGMYEMVGTYLTYSCI